MEQKHIIEDLKTFVSFKTLSTNNNYKEEITKCQEFLKLLFESGGLSAQLLKTPNVDAIFAETPYDSTKKTVLIYGHYDVQPAEKANGWSTEPFELTEKNGNVYGRGTTDDKAPVIALMHAVFSLLKQNKLSVNVKFIIEGEEEIGSVHFCYLVKHYKDMLEHDCVLLSDGYWPLLDTPSLIYGLRGIVYCYVRIDGPATDLHSGMHGGVVKNPYNALMTVLASCQDNNTGKVLIPGFYDDVKEITAEEKAAYDKVPFDINTYKQEIGVDTLWAADKKDCLAKKWAQPTFDIHGIRGGFCGEGAKTIIPSYAEAKVSMRLVPDQDPKKIYELFKQHVHNIAPQTEVKSDTFAAPFMTAIDSAVMKVAEDAIIHAFSSKPLYVREGGSIPALTCLAEGFGKPIAFIPIGLPDDNAHSTDEKFAKDHIFKGISAFSYFLEHIGPIL